MIGQDYKTKELPTPLTSQAFKSSSASKEAPEHIAWKVSRSDPTIASVRYRCFIPARHLPTHFASRVYEGDQHLHFSRQLRAVVFVKSFTDWDKGLAARCKKRGVPYYLDMCDNIFDRPDGCIHRLESQKVSNFIEMAAGAKAIVTTGTYLAGRIKNTVPAARIHVIPDSLETDGDVEHAILMARVERRRQALSPRSLVRKTLGRAVSLEAFYRAAAHGANILRGRSQVVPRRRPQDLSGVPQFVDDARRVPSAEKTVPKLLWYGHGGTSRVFGLTDLREIAAPLQAVSLKRKISVVVISNSHVNYLKYVKPLPFPSVYKEWDMQTIQAEIRACQLTLIPNPLNSFSLAKSANRTMLSLANGVPVVATRTPALDPFSGCIVFDDWYNGILGYLDKPELGEAHVAEGQKLIQQRYTGEAIGRQWGALFDNEDLPVS